MNKENSQYQSTTATVKSKTPILLTVFTLLLLIDGIFTILGSLPALFIGGILLGGFVLVMGIGKIIIAIGLRKARNWAIYGLTFIVILGITSFFIGQRDLVTILAIAYEMIVLAYFWHIFKKTNYQLFSRTWPAIICALLIGGGILAWQYFGALKEEPSKTPKEELTISEEEIIYEKINTSCCGAPSSYTTMKTGLKENSSSGWNTLTIYEYDGDRIGISIDYPSQYEVSYNAITDVPACVKWPAVIFISPEKREIPGYGKNDMMRVDLDSCLELGYPSTFEEFLGVEYFPPERKENIVVDGKPATKATEIISRILPIPEYKELLVWVFINENEKAAHRIRADIDFEKQNIYLPIFNQMLSSFRFLE